MRERAGLPTNDDEAEDGDEAVSGGEGGGRARGRDRGTGRGRRKRRPKVDRLSPDGTVLAKNYTQLNAGGPVRREPIKRSFRPSNQALSGPGERASLSSPS